MTNGFSRSFYRETVQGSGVADGEIIRQRGSIGVYAHVRVEVRGLDRGQGTMLGWNAGLCFPARFVSAVLEGVHDTLDMGFLAGLEITDIYVFIQDGSYHEIDSTADAFREAAKRATTEAVRNADPIILEALSLITITVPLNFIEAIDITLTSHGGIVRVTESESQSRTLSASVPAYNVSELIVELLQKSDGCASISTRSDGFRVRLEPPDPIGSLAAIT